MKILFTALISLTLFVSCAHKQSCACQNHSEHEKMGCADCKTADGKMKPGACKDCEAKESAK